MRRACGDRGQVGGVEALPFGVLIFVAGALLVANTWAVIDAKLAVTAAAREEPTRTSRPAARARPNQLRSMLLMPRSRLADGTRSRATVVVAEGSFSRCTMVTLEVAYVVPTLTLPFVGSWGNGMRVTARHGEIVDPYRNGPEGEADCG